MFFPSQPIVLILGSIIDMWIDVFDDYVSDATAMYFYAFTQGDLTIIAPIVCAISIDSRDDTALMKLFLESLKTLIKNE